MAAPETKNARPAQFAAITKERYSSSTRPPSTCAATPSGPRRPVATNAVAACCGGVNTFQ
jgi:hypothetical protein